MSINYLDIYSAYRDRNTYPKPAEFDVRISSSRKSAANAEDPVSLASPEKVWTGALFNILSHGTFFIQGVVTLATTNVINFVTAGSLQEKENYYINATLISIIDPLKYARIMSYTYLGNNRAQVTLDNRIEIAIGDAFQIFDPTDFSDLQNPLIFIPCGSQEQGAYVNYYIYNETLNEYKIVQSYDNKTGVLRTSSVVGWTALHNYSIQKQLPSLISPAFAGSTNSQVVLGINASAINNAYVGWFLRVPTNTVYNNTIVSPFNEQRRIISYNGITKTATVSPPYTSTVLGLNVQLLQFSYDNFSPFTYLGPLKLETPFFEIKLKKLILPNKVLKVHGGGKTTYHNYVYVELSSIDTPVSNCLLSNNPHATRALFTASIINEKINTDYIVMYGDGMTHKLRFRLDTTLKLKIIMPNGELFETLENDTTSPLQPNPKLQIRALFQFCDYLQNDSKKI